MDEMQTHNRVILCGTPLSSPVFSHASRLEPFYTFPLEVARLSGTVDTINVLLREELLPDLKPSRAGLIRIAGEVRSFNNHSGEGSKLVISVFARELSPPETPVWVNEVELTGTLCKSPNRRTTPMGREICDLMLAVNRLYGAKRLSPLHRLGAERAPGRALGCRYARTSARTHPEPRVHKKSRRAGSAPDGVRNFRFGYRGAPGGMKKHPERNLAGCFFV